MNQAVNETSGASSATSSSDTQEFIVAAMGCPISGQGRESIRSVLHATTGFKLDQQVLPAFAQVSVGNLKLIL